MTYSVPRYWRSMLSNNVDQLTEEEAKKFYLEFLDRLDRKDTTQEAQCLGIGTPCNPQDVYCAGCISKTQETQ